MYEANKALSYFVTHNWEFKNDNFVKLSSFLRLEDVREFDFIEIFTSDLILGVSFKKFCSFKIINIYLFFKIRYTLMGYRRYLLKEKDESLPMCRKRYERFEIASKVINLIPYLFVFYIIFLKYDIINVIKGQFGI